MIQKQSIIQANIGKKLIIGFSPQQKEPTMWNSWSVKQGHKECLAALDENTAPVFVGEI